MKYLSLFSGIGGFELAIQDVFPDAECVGYSEIDKYAIQTYQKHFPGHHNFGDISKVNPFMLPDFDLLVGGFPCQDLSIAKAGRKGLDGNRSGLFWTMLSILRLKQPKYFCFENVASMPKKDRDIITAELGVEPVMINAALVSAQSRKRLFWCNWQVSQPEDRGIVWEHVREFGANKCFYYSNTGLCWIERHSVRTGKVLIIWSGNDKAQMVEASHHKKYSAQRFFAIKDELGLRYITPTECERLQTFEDGWTEGVSNTQRYRQCGNAVCVDVVKHIMECLRKEKE